MRYFTIMLFSVIPLVHGRSLVPSNLTETIEENHADVEKQRSIRVHRVSHDVPLTNSIKNTKFRVPINMANEEEVQHNFWDHLDELKNLVVSQKISDDKSKKGETFDRYEEREALLLKPLKLAVKELSREKTMKLKNLDAEASEEDKPVLKPINNSLKDLLDSPKELDIYDQDNQGMENGVKSSVKLVNDEETKVVKTSGKYLDDVLADIQNQIGAVRNYFDKLCREHHSVPTVPLKEDVPHGGLSINQPKKISIL